MCLNFQYLSRIEWNRRSIAQVCHARPTALWCSLDKVVFPKETLTSDFLFINMADEMQTIRLSLVETQFHTIPLFRDVRP